jgi:GDPmannose 4,6-dehydratase
MTKVAFITGITGQDGSYLAEWLLKQGYQVHGLARRPISDVMRSHLYQVHQHVQLHYGDLTDGVSLNTILDQVRPHEVYNLAAQTHVAISFQAPEVTTNINALGTLRILQQITHNPHLRDTKFYQASTSEMFGNSMQTPQSELTPLAPASPYGIAKLYAHLLTQNFRSSHQVFACAGILFNHESPRRGELFVTRKITQAFARWVSGQHTILELGNLDSRRDWGHAKDYVRAMWMMMQHHTPDDYVIATGTQHSVRDFCNMVAAYFNIPLHWQGSGVSEQAVHAQTGELMIRVNPELHRPLDVINLVGDSSKAQRVLNWQPEYDLNDLVQHMCEHDLQLVKNLMQ